MNTTDEKNKRASRILEAVGDIDEKYIKEAEVKVATANVAAPDSVADSASPAATAEKNAASPAAAAETAGTTNSAEPNVIKMSTKKGIKPYVSAAALVVIVGALGLTIRNMNIPTTTAVASAPAAAAASADTAVAPAAAANEVTVAKEAAAPNDVAVANAPEMAAADSAVVDNAGPVGKAREADMAQGAPSASADEAVIKSDAPNISAAAADSEVAAAAINPEITEVNPDPTKVRVGNVGLANPFRDFATMEEAVESAGYEIKLPAPVGEYTALAYRTIPSDLLEIIYSTEDGTEGYRIRKAPGDEDTSGDYNDYPEEKEVQVGDVTATLEIKDGYVATATWGTGDYSYSITTDEKKFTEDEAIELIKAIS